MKISMARMITDLFAQGRALGIVSPCGAVGSHRPGRSRPIASRARRAVSRSLEGVPAPMA